VPALLPWFVLFSYVASAQTSKARMGRYALARIQGGYALKSTQHGWQYSFKARKARKLSRAHRAKTRMIMTQTRHISLSREYQLTPGHKKLA
jgi:hypothetical protein